MTKFDQILNIKTIEDATEFIYQFIEGNGLESVYICDTCPNESLKKCYNMEACCPKIIRKYLTQEIEQS